jgi:Cu/Zn superoxide dismutase
MNRLQTFAAGHIAHRRMAVRAAALATAGGLAFTLPAAAHEAGHDTGGNGNVRGTGLVFQSPLSDLQTTTTQPLEGATGWLRMTLGNSRSSFVLRIAGIDRAARGTTYGAHLHSGPCVPGDGAAAGPHYNSATPPVIDDRHEVWLDFTVTRKGEGHARAVVPFVPVHGARSIVIHAMETDPVTGAAGDRLACFPVVW